MSYTHTVLLCRVRMRSSARRTLPDWTTGNAREAHQDVSWSSNWLIGKGPETRPNLHSSRISSNMVAECSLGRREVATE